MVHPIGRRAPAPSSCTEQRKRLLQADKLARTEAAQRLEDQCHEILTMHEDFVENYVVRQPGAEGLQAALCAGELGVCAAPKAPKDEL